MKRGWQRCLERRGSIFVESAMVIPVVVMILFALVSLVMEFYGLILEETGKDSEVFAAGFEESRNIRILTAAGEIFNEEK